MEAEEIPSIPLVRGFYISPEYVLREDHKKIQTIFMPSLVKGRASKTVINTLEVEGAFVVSNVG